MGRHSITGWVRLSTSRSRLEEFDVDCPGLEVRNGETDEARRLSPLTPWSRERDLDLQVVKKSLGLLLPSRSLSFLSIGKCILFLFGLAVRTAYVVEWDVVCTHSRS